MARLSILALASLVVVLGAFSFRLAGEPVLPETPYDYDTPLPRHFGAPPVDLEDNTPAANPVTDAGATLGRVLFYDTRLSANGAVSCASCHLQSRAFSDPRPRSVGFEGGATARNSMGLAFARYYDGGRFFWDERAATLEEQVLMPIEDPVEMGLPLGDLDDRLAATTFYPGLFEDAFGTPDVTSDRIARALAQFVRAIVAPNSRYDAGRARQPFGSLPGDQPLDGLTASENRGLDLFFGRARCAVCHRSDVFVLDEPSNNGLDAAPTDAGAGGGRFKMGSLRNVALTAPYMHDGRFATLEEVVEHYSTGVQASATLDPRLRLPRGEPLRLNLSAQEAADLVAFLHTLTDESLATDVRFSDPFAGGTAVAPGPSPAPTLALAGPNPVRGATAFRVALSSAGPARLDVVAMTGRVVATLLDETVSGERTVRWDPSGVAAGVYVVRLTAGGAQAAVPVTVVR